MKQNYDFSNAILNPYVKIKKSTKTETVQIDLNKEVIKYFKNKAKELDIPFDMLINRFLDRAIVK